MSNTYTITVQKNSAEPSVAGSPDASDRLKCEQVYQQTVEVLDMPKLIAAVNYKKRERKPRTARNPNLTPG